MRYPRAAVALLLGSVWLFPLPAWPQLPGSAVVTITSPASGSTVSGTITVQASVSSGGTLIAGVQFKLDGADLGAEDTTAPYSTPWNTAAASNGSHTVTAVARDALGVRYTSDPVTVTVSNGPGGDTTPPTVAITSPGSGATVSGTITIQAAASDNVGVAGVQFLLDGANLGEEDTAAPYSVSWNTTSASNGSHTLTAVARDAAGNRATSAAVAVTVANVPTATRVEDTDDPVTYLGYWNYNDRGRDWSAVTAASSPAAGSEASFTFTGTGISWIGFRGPQTGIARVFLDGILAATVDLYAPAEQVQTAVYTATGLANASHTVKVEVTGLRNPAATHSLVVVDAFDVVPSSPPVVNGTRQEETAGAITYGSGWTQGDTTRGWSGETAAVSTAAGAEASFSFTGTEISWIGFRGPQTGIARVFLDGLFLAQVDTYFPAEVQAVVFRATGLAGGSHTLRIEGTGLKNSAATDSLIVIDAFDTRLRFEETHPSVTYSAGWTHGIGERAFSGGTMADSAIGSAQAVFTFSGTSVSWISFRGPQVGIARVFLDGAFVAEVDTYSATEEVRVPVFTATGLAPSLHTLRIEVTGQKHPASESAFVVVDAFDVTP